MEPDEPPRKNYDFKERVFQRDNAVGADAAPMPTAQDLAKLAGPSVPSQRDKAGPRANDPNDVFAVLQHNRVVEQKHGLNDVKIRQRRSKRKRDYWLLLVPSDLLLGLLMWQGRSNPVIFVYGISGLVVLTLSITWIMWFVMDDY
jgi:hypothetical protein